MLNIYIYALFPLFTHPRQQLGTLGSLAFFGLLHMYEDLDPATYRNRSIARHTYAMCKLLDTLSLVLGYNASVNSCVFLLLRA